MSRSGPSADTAAVRTIIHLDMDCFYAAIEVRERPELRGRPVAVGGTGRRGVLTTANYEARRFGCRSAMPTWRARELCPELAVVPVRFDLYRAESARVRAIMRRFTGLIEPLSLDEAYLDVSHLHSSGWAIAWELRCEIREELALTASAGIAPNKLLAKIASDWNKPDGQFEVRPEGVDAFMRDLPVRRLSGVGGKMEEKLAALGVRTCGDLQQVPKVTLAARFGKWGLELHELCRGRDERPVETSHVRKSLSREVTLRENAASLPELAGLLEELQAEVADELHAKHRERRVRGLVVKLKFADFTRTTAERAHPQMDAAVYQELLGEAWSRGGGKAVRLIGLGVRLAEDGPQDQLDLGLG